MNKLLEIVFTIVGAFSVLLNFYSLIKSSRKLYLYGLCSYSFLTIITESIAYYNNRASYHFLMVCLFAIQFALAYPNENSHRNDNPAARKLISKIGLSFLMVNIAAAIIAFKVEKIAPIQFAYFYVGFILALFYLIYKRVSTEVLH